MRKSVFTHHLSQLSEEELREELTHLYDKVEEVKSYYRIELGSDVDRGKWVASIKKQVASCFITRSRRKPRRPRIKKMQSLLKEASKKSIYDHELADIFIDATEQASGFMSSYNFYSETLHNNILKTFRKSLQLAKMSLSIDDYNPRIQMIVNNKGLPYEVRLALIKIKEEELD